MFIRYVGAVVGLILITGGGLVVPETSHADPATLLYSTEGNRLRRYDVDTLGGVLVEDILVEQANAAESGGAAPTQNFRDINGMACLFPDSSGRFVAGEDTGQPTPPPGWGIFSATGVQIGKLTATYFAPQGEPFGCGFSPDGSLFTSSVGTQGFGDNNGQLILWFPPFEGFPGPPGAYPGTNDPSDNFCKIANDIGTAGALAIDDLGRVYVASASQLSIFRYSPPFPTGPDAAGGCGGVDALGSPVADGVNKETFVAPSGLSTYTGLAFAPNGNLYASKVVSGEIDEFDTDGNFIRRIVDPPEALPPISTGTPQGIAVGLDGTVYYADLDLVGDFPDLDTGSNGKVWRVRFDSAGDPLPPEIVRQNLAFPDGVSLFPGDLEPFEWRSYAGGGSRTFFNSNETQIRAENVDQLTKKWTLATGAVVTASPSIARVDVPGEGRIRVAFIQSWDANVYAVRVRDGSLLWSFLTEDRDGVSFPNTASPHVANRSGQDVVYIGNGQTFYALRAWDGQELWRFDAGTGCDPPPGLCGYDGERNEIESSAIVVDDKVVFAMDVNDDVGGKGGIYGLDADLGRLVWFFDLESGDTCEPFAGDEIRAYDPYHSEAELGLPSGFLATRPGCDHPRTPNGCGNVWSSPAHDAERGHLYFASSNCETDTDPGTLEPLPPMPPYDEAIFALDYDGKPVWRWRPREVDNDDLAFGAAPNLFTVKLGGEGRDIVGVGNKDGTYYALGRDGVNEISGVAWDDADPSALPYWTRNVVAGGPAGGIIATAAVDDFADRIYFSTAPGSFDAVFTPQRPTMHALDARTGAILWQNDEQLTADASFAPTSAIHGVAFSGSTTSGTLRSYAVTDGTQLGGIAVGFSLSSAPAVVDGTLIVGAGTGFRSGDPGDPGDIASNIPSNVTGLCVPGTPACALDQLISGRRLRVTDHLAKPTRRRLDVQSRDAGIVPPIPGTATDPTQNGMTLQLANTTTLEEQSIALPAEGWKGLGFPAGSKGYRYRDAKRVMGPCTKAQLKAGRIQTTCRGEALTYSLDEANQGNMAVGFSFANEIVLCARFGGTVTRDLGAAGTKSGRFYAKQAPVPASCPLP